MSDGKTVAILIPCYNEELTIGKVIEDFRNAVPQADIYVYDNNSTDLSAEIARKCGAIVRECPIQGKGAVVKQMFEEIDADKYLMVDADDTYPPELAQQMLYYLDNMACNMIIGDRLSVNYYEDNTRRFHGIGNSTVKWLVNHLFHGYAIDVIQEKPTNITDVMTGYRAFDRKFVKSIGLTKDGFEVETEMTILALKKGLHIGTMPIPYRDRPEGSYSKLSTIRDGIKVLRLIFQSLFNHVDC
jgi:glycosyltransferase involved in cell wall biosynthesis